MKANSLILSLFLLVGCRPELQVEAKRGDLSQVKPIAETRADAVIAKAQRMIEKMPKSTKGYGALGQALMQRARETGRLDDYAAALTAFEKAVSLDKQDAVALHDLAWCWTMFHRFDKARNLADQAIKLAPTDPTAYGVKFDSEMELGHYTEAGNAGQKMLDLRPCLASYSRAAQYRWTLGDAKGAVILMEKAMEAGGPYAENWLWCMTQIGDFSFKTGNMMAAEQSYNRALSYKKDYKHALFGLGRVRLSQGKVDEGIELMSRATAQACPILYRIEYASLLKGHGQAAKANEQFAKIDAAIAEHGSYGIKGDEVAQAESWMARGENLGEALKLMESESKEHVNWQTLSALAWAQALNGQSEKSQLTIDAAVKCGAQEPVMLARAAEIHRIAGNVERSTALRMKAEALNAYMASNVKLAR